MIGQSALIIVREQQCILVMGKILVKFVAMKEDSIMVTSAFLEICKHFKEKEMAIACFAAMRKVLMLECDVTCSKMDIGDGSLGRREGGAVHATGD
jgi:hypothetical protein